MRGLNWGMINRNWAIGLLLVAYLSLGLLYSIVNPLFEAPDEHYHFDFINHLVQERRLPVQFPEAPRSERHQPPLYYVLGALLTFGVDTDDLPQFLERNPYWGHEIGLVGSDNKNQFLHGDEEGVPYSGTVLAVRLVRLLSVVLGAITLLATYLTAKEIFPHRPGLALGGVAFVAFNPQFIFINSAVTNDSLATTLATLVLLLLAQTVTRGFSTPRNVCLGVLLGLALLTKVAAVFLIPVVVLALAAASFDERSWGSFIRSFSLVLSISFLLAGWWFARNLILYGDWLGLSRMWEVWGAREPPADLAQILADLPRVERSYWANFGWGNVPVSNEIYQLLALMVRASLLGWLVLSYRQIRGGVFRRREIYGVLVLASWTGLILLGLALYLRRDPYASGRYLFPAISAISILLFLGLAQYLPSRFTLSLAGVTNATMFALALVSLSLYLAPAYARPPLLSGDLAIPHPLEITYGGKMRLLGYEVDKERVRPGEALQVTLYWRSLAEMEKNYSVFVHLYGREKQLLGQRDTYPGLGNYPTRLWRVGDTIGDTYRVPIAKEGLAPTRVAIEVGLYDLSTMERLPAFDKEMAPLDYPVIGQVKLVPRHPPEYFMLNPVHFNLGGEVALVGYEMERGRISPGGTVHLTLYWQALTKMDRGYTVFTHLIDGEGGIWAQRDDQPLKGDYPTSLWDGGEIVKDDYELVVEADLPAGGYQVEVGMYSLETMERLPLLGEEGEVVGDRILLGEVYVGSP